MNALCKGLLSRNPLRIMHHGNTGEKLDNSFGLILARAGIGKTALVVQLAIDSILQNKSILHVSLIESMDKVRLWYEEILSNLAELYKLNQINKRWESVELNRFIMTFKVEKFSVPTFEERLGDLMGQRIFHPKIVIIDGLSFNESEKESLEELKSLSNKHSLHIWFTSTIHRHEKLLNKNLPLKMSDLSKIFDDIVQLKTENERVEIESLKGGSEDKNKKEFFLNPSSMLIQKIS